MFDLKDCIEACRKCSEACGTTLFTHCLEEGGKHMAKAHVLLMTDCMQICNVAASFLSRQSENMVAVCILCAEICEACAESCWRLGDEHMDACTEACRECARLCREMVGEMRKAA